MKVKRQTPPPHIHTHTLASYSLEILLIETGSKLNNHEQLTTSFAKSAAQKNGDYRGSNTDEQRPPVGEQTKSDGCAEEENLFTPPKIEPYIAKGKFGYGGLEKIEVRAVVQ